VEKARDARTASCSSESRPLDRVYAYLHIELSDKLLRWLGSSRSDVRVFPRDARRLAGFQRRRVQQGLDPTDWKAMPGVGPGVREIRIHTALEHRILYVAKFVEAVYVLHAFADQTAATQGSDGS
jgi:phage-related protein